MYLSWPTTAEGLTSVTGSGFQRLMPLNLYMCQWLWFNRVTAHLAQNKSWTTLPCLASVDDMSLRFLTCQGGGNDAMWVDVSNGEKLRWWCVEQQQLFQSLSTGLLESQKNQAGVVCPLYSSVYPPIYPTCVTWANLLTFMPQGPRFTSCFFSGSELLSHVPRIKGNTCRHSLTSPSVTVKTLWETITSRYSVVVIMFSASESVHARVCVITLKYCHVITTVQDTGVWEKRGAESKCGCGPPHRY